MDLVNKYVGDVGRVRDLIRLIEYYPSKEVLSLYDRSASTPTL